MLLALVFDYRKERVFLVSRFLLFLFFVVLFFSPLLLFVFAKLLEKQVKTHSNYSKVKIILKLFFRNRGKPWSVICSTVIDT